MSVDYPRGPGIASASNPRRCQLNRSVEAPPLFDDAGAPRSAGVTRPVAGRTLRVGRGPEVPLARCHGHPVRTRPIRSVRPGPASRRPRARRRTRPGALAGLDCSRSGRIGETATIGIRPGRARSPASRGCNLREHRLVRIPVRDEVPESPPDPTSTPQANAPPGCRLRVLPVSIAGISPREFMLVWMHPHFQLPRSPDYFPAESSINRMVQVCKTLNAPISKCRESSLQVSLAPGEKITAGFRK